MAVYIFQGIVVPERAQVNLTGLAPMEVVQPDSGLRFRLKVNIVLSKISAHVTSDKPILDISSLKNYLTDTISFLVDCIGYGNGCGYTVEIDSCTYNEGDDYIVFGVNIDDLQEERRWESTLNVIEAYSRATDLQKPQLQRSLSELKRGIKVSQDTGFHIYRAIESIQSTFDGNTDAAKWRNMNTALNLNRTYTDNLREAHANPQRHGAYTFMPSTERVEMLIKGKTIISRFVSYIRSGSQNLSSANYPKLA